MQNFSQKRIAIVADWLIDFWWAELVLSHLLEIFPHADIYTSVCTLKHPMLKWHKIHTSWIEKVPFFRDHHKLAGVLRPFAFRSFDLSEYDIIICSSSAESKQISVRNSIFQKKKENQVIKKQVIFCYCHTPIRYYWSHYEDYLKMLEFGWLNPLARFFLKRCIRSLRRIDLEWAQKIDYFIANSENTLIRIRKYYRRDSTVIYPGAYIPDQDIYIQEAEKSETKFIKPPEYYIALGRCVPYKKFDLLVDTFNKNGKKLILCTSTDTPLYRELRRRSRSNIEWKFGINDHEKYKLVALAKWLLFPPEEDFGLVPVEAMMLGTPVIAFRRGWATETVIEWITGTFFREHTVESLSEAIERFETIHWDRWTIRIHAEKFSKETFQENLLGHIASLTDIYPKKMDT